MEAKLNSRNTEADLTHGMQTREVGISLPKVSYPNGNAISGIVDIIENLSKLHFILKESGELNKVKYHHTLSAGNEVADSMLQVKIC